MLKWILSIVGVLVGLIILIVIVGLLLPKTHTASRRVRYGQPADRLWEVISRFENHARWQPDVKRIERLEDRDGHAVWREVHSRGDSLTMEVVELEPPTRMVTRVVDNRQFGGTWTWEVEPLEGTSCALTITENGEIYNPIFRFVARFIMGYHATMDAFHRALGGELGEEVTLD